MSHVRHLRCMVCAEHYQPDEVDYVCPHHGNDGTLDVVYDYEQIAQHFSKNDLAACADRSIWRYLPLLPLAGDAQLSGLAVGGTPLIKARHLAQRHNLDVLYIKDDGRNPTASFKDRASAIAVAKAQEKGARVVTTASTGNAAAALAGICANVQQPCVIFVPQSAPQAKIAQLLAYGATVLLVQGSYDQAFELCLQAAEQFGWYNRNTGYNPYMTEGKKTVSYEICEQLEWQAPDVVFVSVGDGSIIGGVHKGFKDLLQLGWIDHMPRLIGVQAAGSNFLAEAWAKGEDVLTKQPIVADTVADSISAGLPRDRLKAMRAVVESDGAFVTVSDDQILASVAELAGGSGVFAEPAGAAAYAGLRHALDNGIVTREQRIVVINTGNGLKDVAAAMRAVGQSGRQAHVIGAAIQEVKQVISEI